MPRLEEWLDFGGLAKVAGMAAMVGVFAVVLYLCSERKGKWGVRVWPSSEQEGRAILLRGFQGWFVAAVLAAIFTGAEAPEAMLMASWLGMTVCGLAFQKTNGGLAMFWVILTGAALMGVLLFPAVEG